MKAAGWKPSRPGVSKSLGQHEGRAHRHFIGSATVMKQRGLAAADVEDAALIGAEAGNEGGGHVRDAFANALAGPPNRPGMCGACAS